MADEKKPAGDKPAPPKPDPFVDIVWTMVTIFLVLYAFNAVLAFFTGGNGNLASGGWRNFTPRNIILSETQPISSLENPLGAKFVVTSYSADVFGAPGGAKIAEKRLGDKGTIVGGPITEDGQKYWKVKFEDGTTGWISEKDIGALPQKITPMSEMETLIGTPVETMGSTPVYSEPGGKQIAIEPAGSGGTILEGPIIKNGVKYWHVIFDDGVDGWVREGDLYSLRDGKKPLSTMDTLIGGDVVSSKDGVEIFDTPGGRVVGTVDKGQSGEIIEGPLVRNGVKYWHVRFDNGQEGWVSENDLNYVEEGELSPLARIVIFIWKLLKYVKYLLILLSIVLVGFIYHLFKSLSKLRIQEKSLLYPQFSEEDSKKAVVKNSQWEKVVSHVNSENQNDWRQGIMEADIMLDDLLGELGLVGDNMGEKLKSVNRGDFKTIDNAWEAHKVRNNIAHEGLSFGLTHREAKRVISLYKSVFDEFKLI